MINTVLLPCPFCGKKPEWVNLLHPSGIPAIQCPQCQFSMQDDRRDKTIFLWNRRQTQWVKVSERLPKKSGYYHVKTFIFDAIYPEGCQYSVEHKMWGAGHALSVIEWLEEGKPPKYGT